MHKTFETMAASPAGRRLALRSAVIGAMLIAVSFSTAGHAQTTGVAACDEFLNKYETCVTSKVPASMQATYKTQLDQTRKMWLDMAKNPAMKSGMEASCKQTIDAMKTALQSYGCTF